jgi:hypothetical protein
MTSTERFVEDLLIAVPELQAVYKVHMDDNGTLLPHVFMGDDTRFALQIAWECSESAGTAQSAFGRGGGDAIQ